MMRLFSLFLSLIVLLVAAGYVWLTGVYAQQKNTLTAPVETTITPGTSGQEIAALLADENIIQHPEIFRLLAKLRGEGHRFQAGEYAFEAALSPLQVIAKLRDGDIIVRQVTLPEGKTNAEIIALINAAPELAGTLTAAPAEGSLLPNTYRYQKGETRQSILSRMRTAQQNALEALWPKRATNLPIRTPQEALILASIVEKETGLSSERQHVAGLYLNRLRKGMLLQADPTVAYGVYGGQYANKPLRRSHLKKDTPYNTYLHTGLPPTPICNPGKAAIAAVLNPATHDDYYMVARGDGGHFFAQTHRQHLANVAKYRQWQRENGLR